LSGWRNYLDKSEVTEAIAEKRAAFCAVCPNAKTGMLSAFINDRIKAIKGTYCVLCGCPLSAKVRSTDICPENKWK
jgi:hypothetical protein